MRNQEIRERVCQAVSHLITIDDRLGQLAESLALPPDAEEMWDSQIPTSFTTNLYAALSAVRTDCLRDATSTLLSAIQQSETSLRRDWLASRQARFVADVTADLEGARDMEADLEPRAGRPEGREI